MATQPGLEEFQFPDEAEQPAETASTVTATPSAGVEVEIIDDTPPQDRNREPMSKEVVQELENDDLEEYSEKVKKRLAQMKKVWHDERREKERAIREREEAFRFAESRNQENKQLKEMLTKEKKLSSEQSVKVANNELAAAKERLKQAYMEGDAEKIADAQEELTDIKLRLRETENTGLALQRQEDGVESSTQQVQAQPTQQVPDPKAQAWKQRNAWFGVDEEMTSLALGLHGKLVRSGVDPRSDDYYHRVDATMRKRFPEYFEEAQSPTEPEEKPAPRKAATVVAPATRSTAPKKVRLSSTQMGIIKKFNLDPEAYANEVLKLENSNG